MSPPIRRIAKSRDSFLPADHWDHSAEAENYVCAASVLFPHVVDTLGWLQGPHFHDPDLGKFFDLVRELRTAGEIVDRVTIRSHLRTAGLFLEIGGLDWLAKNLHIAADHSEYYARRIVELYQSRRLDMLASSMIRSIESSSSPAEVIGQTATELEAVSRTDILDAPSNEETIAEIFEDIASANERESNTIATGFDRVDQLSGGFQAGDMVVLAARTSIGKTALAVDMMYNAAVQGHEVLFFSLEMTRKQLLMRMLSRETGISFNRIKDGRKLTPHEKSLLSSAAQLLGALPFSIVDGGNSLTCDRMRAIARVARAKQGVDLIIVDYLQRIPTRGHMSSYERVTGISSAVKDIAMDEKINAPVLCLAQLNRMAESQSPGLEHLKDSGAIEQDADFVFFLDRKRGSTETKLNLAKQRNGRVASVLLDFDEVRMTFTEHQ